MSPSMSPSRSNVSSSAVSPRRWPASPLAAAARAFDLLTCEPDPLAFDARGLPVLPQRILPLDELRDLLTADSTPKPVRDLVWRGLVARARRDGPTWVVAAAGIAMPGLRMKAGMLTRRWHGDTADLDAEMITGFVERLKTINLDLPRICGRLIDAGARAVKKSRLAEEEASAVHVDTAWSRTPSGPWDHPDWVLTRTVAAAVIDPEEHQLIADTRLDEIPLAIVAPFFRPDTDPGRTGRRPGTQQRPVGCLLDRSVGFLLGRCWVAFRPRVLCWVPNSRPCVGKESERQPPDGAGGFGFPAPP